MRDSGEDDEGYTSVKINSYTVDNRLLTVTGTKGTYTSSNYQELVNDANTYLLPSGSTVTLTSVYTIIYIMSILCKKELNKGVNIE